MLNRWVLPVHASFARLGALAHMVENRLSAIQLVASRFSHVWNIGADLIREPASQSNKIVEIALAPTRENRQRHSLTRTVNPVGHRLALRRDRRFTDASVTRVSLAIDQAETFELCDLTADGGVVPTDPIGEIHYSDRFEPLDHDQQWEQRPIERNSCLTHHGFVALRTVHHTHNVEKCTMEFPQPRTDMCIMHF